MTIKRNDLYDYYGLSIYQDDDRFKFSLDSILLAEFVNINRDDLKIVDFCTGNAPVPMILSTKYSGHITGIELQKYIYDMGVRSIKENGLEDRIDLINEDVKEVNKYLDSESFDVVTCNPPYFKYNSRTSLVNEVKEKAIARHEIELDLESMAKACRYVLKNKGVFYLVHRCDRLEEIVLVLNKYGFSIKKLQFVYTGGKEASIVLIKAIKNGNVGSLKVAKGIDISSLKSYKGIFEG